MHWTNISCFQLGLLQSSKTTVCKDQVYPLQIEMATSIKHHKGRIPKTYPILPHLQWCLWGKKSTGRVWVFFQYGLQMSNCLWLFPATSHVDNLIRFATRGRKLSNGWDFLGLFTLKIRDDSIRRAKNTLFVSFLGVKKNTTFVNRSHDAPIQKTKWKR